MNVSILTPIELEIDGHRATYKPWNVRQDRAFWAKYEKCQTVPEFKALAYETCHDGLISFDGKSGQEAADALDNLQYHEMWSLCLKLYESSSLSVEDKKKSEPSPSSP